MKNLVVASLMVLFSSQVFAAEIVTETVGVNGMVCSFCAQGITKKFKALPEVADVDVNLAEKQVKISYKEGQTLSHDKISELLKESGYEVRFDSK